MDTPHPGWWTTLRPGDPVILARGGYGGWRAVCHVERVTKTQLLIANRRHGEPPYRFRLTDGQAVGGQASHHQGLCPYTDAIAASIRQEHAHATLLARFQQITAQDLGGLTVEQCEGLTACLTTHGL